MKRTPEEKAAQDYAASVLASAFSLDEDRAPFVTAALREAFLAGVKWHAAIDEEMRIGDEAQRHPAGGETEDAGMAAIWEAGRRWREEQKDE
jgi:hypothetical protein